MLYLSVSTQPSARERVHVNMAQISPANVPTRITAEDVIACDMVALAGTQELFGGTLCFFFDGAFTTAAARERVVEHARTLAQSPNHFFILETALDAATIKAISKHATHTDIEKTNEAKERSGGFFSVSDALGSRDRKKLWVEIVRAHALGAAPEEIHGVMWWGVKNMLLAREARTAQDVGLNPFVFNKAKSYAANFKGDELQKLADEVSTLLYRARSRNIDAAIALERFALTV